MSETQKIVDHIVLNLYEKVWSNIEYKKYSKKRKMEPCTCDDYCRYGCKRCRTGCYNY